MVIKAWISNLFWIFGELEEMIPPTLHYGIAELNPKKAVWRVRYRQGYPNCVWFDRHPKELDVKTIGKNSYSGSRINAAPDVTIEIGSDVSIGNNLAILNKLSHEYDARTKKGMKAGLLKIGKNVWIGDNVAILVGKGGISISEGSVVGYGSIVTKSLEKKNGVYSGSPAEFKKVRDFKLV